MVTEPGRPLRKLVGPPSAPGRTEPGIACACLTPDGRTVLAGRGSSILEWELSSGQLRRTFEAAWNEYGIHSLCVTPDGRWLLAGAADNIRIWDLTSGDQIHLLEGHTEPVYSLAVTPDGRFALSAAHDATLRLWRLSDGRCRKVLTGHDSAVWSVAVIAGGRYAVSGSWDQTLRVWELPQGRWELPRGRCVKVLPAQGCVTSVAGAANGEYILAASTDELLIDFHRVLVWEPGLGHSFLDGSEAEDDRATAVWMAPDGKRALTSAPDGDIRLWDVVDRRCLRILGKHASTVLALAVSPDGNLVLSGGQDGQVLVWAL